MGKASSSKKVARAAGLGGSRNFAARPAWNYYFAVFTLVVLGVIGVYNSREYLDNKVNGQGNKPPVVHQSPPWFEGYAIDECGKLLPSIKDTANPDGIYTKGNGVIYISPKIKSAAGSNATLGKFASAVGMTLNAGELQVPGSRLYTNGDTCEGKPGHVYVMTWANPSAPPEDGILQDKNEVNQTTGMEDTCNPDCDSGVLLENDQLVTIAFLPAPAKHHSLSTLQPLPSVISELANLVSTGGTTTTGAATVPSSASSSTTATTAKGKATTKTDTTVAHTGTTKASTTGTTKAPTTATTSAATTKVTTTATTKAKATPTTKAKSAAQAAATKAPAKTSKTE